MAVEEVCLKSANLSLSTILQQRLSLHTQHCNCHHDHLDEDDDEDEDRVVSVPRDLCFHGSQPPLGFEMFCMRRPAASDCMKSATCLSPGSPASPVAGQLKNHSSCQLLPYFSCSCSCFSCSLNGGGKVEPVAN